MIIISLNQDTVNSTCNNIRCNDILHVTIQICGPYRSPLSLLINTVQYIDGKGPADLYCYMRYNSHGISLQVELTVAIFSEAKVQVL